MKDKRFIVSLLFIFFFSAVFSYFISYLPSAERATTDLDLLPETGNTLKSSNPSPLPGTTVYVCTIPERGCNYVGTSGITQAIQNAVPNTNIIIRKGTYEQVGITFSNNNVLSISGEGNRETILLGKPNSAIFRIGGTQNIVLRNLTVKNASLWGILIEGAARVTLDQLTVSKSQFSNIAVVGNSNVLINNCVSSLSQHYGLDITGNSQAEIKGTSVYDNAASGIKLSNVTGGTTTIANNSIFRNRDQGIHVAQTGLLSISGNTVYGNQEGIVVDKVLGLTLYSNIIRNNVNNGLAINTFEEVSVTQLNYSIYGNVIKNNYRGILLGGNRSNPRAHLLKFNIRSNLLVSNGYTGLQIEEQSVQSKIQFQVINNVATGNTIGFWVRAGNSGNNLVNMFVNNIAYKNQATGVLFSTLPVNTKYFFAYNNSYENFPNWQNTRPETINYSEDPGFVNHPNNLHLRSNSTMINKGMETIKDPDQSRSDLGAYGGPLACALDPLLAGCPLN